LKSSWRHSRHLSFRGSELGFDPPTQTLSVEASNGSRFTWEASWDANWLTVTPQPGRPVILSVRAATRDLSQGTYRDTIYVVSGEALNSPLAVPVELIVDAPQVRLAATPESVFLEAVRPGGDSVAQTVAVTADAVSRSRGPPLRPTLADHHPRGRNDTRLHDVSIDLREFPLGEYNDTIIVVSDVALNSPLQIPVFGDARHGRGQNCRFAERLRQSGSVLSNHPRTGRLDISSSTGEAIDWSLSWTEPWLTVEPVTGRAVPRLAQFFPLSVWT